ncbi:polysaccharide deacetylase family protein [Sporosarcina gallistercoris]|uniref:Polysaccharide deacetylase family protein n=1 Tax=Sporosarcina gallistercoris TaxID=2762245 RepID=A0ABR8PIW3_9BACL|nr:polysaccharide deacetylase family protein [Sporosarcina gallistercoris]MBD7908019.1 polysaccharide deacetylase family protein [Sporosarcina gallistercoris]
MKRFLLLVFVLVACFAVIILGNQKNSTLTETMMTISNHSISDVGSDVTHKAIESYAKDYEVKPIDAKIDRVWKAIPGYNGLTVDVEKSYQKMLDSNDFNTDHLVFKEVPPKIHLDDLPPSPIYKGNPEKPMAALLINVAWGEEYIPSMLNTLKQAEVKATFFFDGSWVKRNPDILTRISMEGHEIGNHAYSHPNLANRSRQETVTELSKTNEVIEATLGVKPQWFAPPSGSFNQTTIDVAHDLKMKTILWTVDTVDWKKPDTTEMVTRVLSKVENGSMILMHPTQPTSDGLETIIEGTKKKGMKLGTVSELMSEERVEHID